MDRWLIKTCAPSSGKAGNATGRSAKHAAVRHSPYVVPDLEQRQSSSLTNKRNSFELPTSLGTKPTGNAITKHLLSTLSEPTNPITHSNISERSDHVSTAATGHQRAEERVNRRLYLQDRERKLEQQIIAVEDKASGGILSGCRIYIDGYLEDTTDMEMKRTISLAGGQVLQTASGATHILTSQQLSGRKTHKVLTSKMKLRPHVVHPEWVTESIENNKRLAERAYSVLRDRSTPTLERMFESPSPNKQRKGLSLSS